MLIDLIRHGEPEGGRMYRGGGIDDPLSPLGWRQMRAAVAAAPPWTRILCSPMRRCAAFAQELAQQRHLPLEHEPRLREMNFGAWEGRRPAAIQAADARAYQAFLQDPRRHLPAGAEPLDALLGRVGQVLAELAAGAERDHVLIVAHGGVIRAAVAWVTGIPTTHLFRLKLDYAQVTRFESDPGMPARLVFHGRDRFPSAARV